MTKEKNIPLKKYRFNIEAYHRLGETGIIAPDCHVELINGEIIEMSPINSPHSGTVILLNRILNKMLGDEWVISVQNPVEVDQYSEPEPDLAVLKYRDDLYTKSHPKPEEILFLIEVADTFLEKDQQVKLPLYALFGIPEVWIVNLPKQQIEVYTQPTEQGYSQIRIYRKADVIQTENIKGLAVTKILI